MNVSKHICRTVFVVALVAVAGAHAMIHSAADEDTLSSSLPIVSGMSVTPMCVDAQSAPGGKVCYEASVVVGQPEAGSQSVVPR